MSTSNLPARAHRAGDRIAGYTLDDVVGAGGMGTVWRAHADDGSVVAIKLLHASLANSDVLVQRFLREVALGRRIDHPGVVHTLDGGLIDGGPDAPSQPWLAMDFVRGRTLRQRVEADGPLAEAEVRAVGALVADALEAVHAAGVVHRDVKPDNVLQDEQGRIRLMDLGVARGWDEALRLTRSGQFAGSVVYAAPEQFLGGSARLDGRADLYALGVSLYELATGEVPWPGMDLLAVYGEKMRGAAPAPSARRPLLSPEFDAIVRRLMAADPNQRPTTAAELAKWLRGEVRSLGRDDDGLTYVATAEQSLDLPRRDDAFVGRMAELHHLDRAWEGSRLVTLTGVAGSGKTRLSLEYGIRYRLRFPGGVRFADLSESVDEAGVIAAVASCLRVALTGGDAALAIESALRGQSEVLLILDNAEQVRVGVTDLVARWRVAAPEASFLVTSRVALGLPGEVVFPVEALGLPASDALDVVADADAVRLFVGRARELSPRFALDAGNAAAVAAVVRGLDGLPLAIELCAARVKVLSPAQILEKLEGRWALLRGRAGERPARQAALLDAIRWSWDLLDADHQSVLAQLSAFEGGFTAEAAEAVVELGAPGDLWVVDALDDLAGASLIRRMGGDPVRFGFYAAIHQFARERLEARGTDVAGSVYVRHAHHFGGLARDEGRRWMDDANPAALARLVEEQANLRAATRRSTGVAAARSAWALGLIAERRGPVELGVTTLAEVVARRDVEGPEQLGLLASLARLQGLASQLEAGLRTWTQVEQLASRSGDEVEAAYALTARSSLHMRAGRMDEARRAAQEGLDAFTRLGHRRGVAAAHRAAGVVALHTGELDAGRRHFLAGLDGLAEDDARGRSALYNNLGLLEVRAGRPVEGAAWLEQSLAYDRSIGDRVSEGSVLTNLGILAAQRGRIDEARVRFEEALEAHRDGGNAEAEAKALNNLAQIHQQSGALDLAWSLAQSALAIKRTLGQPGAEAYGRVQLGEIELKRGRFDVARHELEQALTLGEGAGERMLVARARELLAELATTAPGGR